MAYFLCFECENEFGKKEVYPLLCTSLEFVDMYTVFCKDKEDLLRKLPDGKQLGSDINSTFSLPDVKGFIYEHFNLEGKNYEFYLREANGSNVRKGRKKIPVLYSDDRDVVYLNKGTATNEVLGKLLDLEMSVAECNDACIKSLTGTEHEKNKIKLDFFWNTIEKIANRNERLIGMFERHASDAVQNRAALLATSRYNLILLAEESKRDPMLRRQLALDIKEVYKKLDDLTNEKTRLISKDEAYDRQKRREQISKFRISKVMENMRDQLNDEKLYYEEKYNKKEVVEKYGRAREDDEPSNPSITDKEILEYNKERYKQSNDKGTNEIIELLEELTMKKMELEQLISEENKYNDVINKGSFDISRETAEKKLKGIESSKKDLLKEISELEYKISELESGQVSYSDAGFKVNVK